MIKEQSKEINIFLNNNIEKILKQVNLHRKNQYDKIDDCFINGDKVFNSDLSIQEQIQKERIGILIQKIKNNIENKFDYILNTEASIEKPKVIKISLETFCGQIDIDLKFNNFNFLR